MPDLQPSVEIFMLHLLISVFISIKWCIIIITSGNCVNIQLIMGTYIKHSMQCMAHDELFLLFHKLLKGC